MEGYLKHGKKYLNRLEARGIVNKNDITRIRGLAIMQKLTNKSVSDLATSPGLMRDVLGGPRMKALRDKPGLYKAFYGKAVELRVAKLVKDKSSLRRLYSHVGDGGGAPSVDFIGHGQFKGLEFDVTTVKQYHSGIKFQKYGDDVLVPAY
ncbi:hypothetical protein [Persicirhabdus sediminis]|nr:hypothetical protein [Persicirhabdus sediminis]